MVEYSQVPNKRGGGGGGWEILSSDHTIWEDECVVEYDFGGKFYAKNARAQAKRARWAFVVFALACDSLLDLKN